MLVVALSAVFSAFFSLVFTPLYEATAQFYVPQDLVASGDSARSGLIRVPGLREQARTYVAVLESRDAHKAVADRLVGRSLEDVLHATDFDVSPAASIVIFARDKDPAVAKHMVELFIEYFESFHLLRLNDAIKILEEPHVSSNPVFPLVTLNTFVGMLGGLVIGIIYALFLDHLQTRTLANKLKRLEGEDWFANAVSEVQKGRDDQ